jgi:FMN phosphatase YigB (HAD superfamily)
MNDLKFYARFLSIYAAKMKKDWVKEDKGYKGKGLIERRRNFEEKQEEKQQKAYKKIVQKEEKIYEESTSDESNDPFEQAKRWLEERKKKKYKKLWKNTISLDEYKGILFVDIIM